MILQVRTVNLETGKVKSERRIVFNIEGKEWLRKHMYWALINKHGVQIINDLDKGIAEKL